MSRELLGISPELSEAATFELNGLTPKIYEDIANFMDSEVNPGHDDKYIMPLNSMEVVINSNGMSYRKKGGLFVVDKNAGLFENNNGVDRVKPELVVPSEIHENMADLWIYDGRKPMEFLVGEILTDPYNQVKDGKVNRREFLGSSIEGARRYVLSEEHPFLLIPPRIPHAHGGDGIVSAYIQKLSFPEAIKVSRFKGLVTIAGVGR